MRKLPIGKKDFSYIRENNLYYVDKSMFIADILDGNGGGAYLFTRPRRFGKSLNLSMLDRFLNIQYKGNTWFDGLEISKHHEYDIHKNAYPVITLSFNRLEYDDYDLFQMKMKDAIVSAFKMHRYLMESEKVPIDSRVKIRSILFGEKIETTISSILEELVEALYAHYGKRVVILIDEYDKPMNDTYGADIADKVRGFIKALLTSILKDNDYVDFAVITGVMQIAKESIFSGLNNLEVNNVFTLDCSEMFGFTDEEVKQMCEDFGHPEKYEEARDWYDGYRFGNADIYNPWSLLNYVKNDFVPDTYWAGTSGNDIIPKLLDFADSSVQSDLSKIAEGGSISASIDTSVAYCDLTLSKNSFYSVLVMSGYLKAVGNGIGNDAELSIPNREMRNVFGKAIINKYTGGSEVLRFLNGMLENNVKKMSESLYEMLTNSVSSRVLESEHSYQSFILGATMYLGDRYRITGDFESGNGYHDMRMECIRGDYPNVVIEVKRTHDRKEDPNALAAMALKQIHDMDYAHGLKGETILYGIAFDGKKPCIESETLDL